MNSEVYKVSGTGSRIKRAIAAGALGQIINLFGRLALVPMFLKVWGAELYGSWLMVTALTSILAMSDFGGGVYFVNRLTELRQLGEDDKFFLTLSSSIALFTILPIIIVLIFITVAFAVPIASWMNVENVNENILLVVLIILGIQVCISIPQGLLLGVYRAIGAQATSVMYGNALLLGQLAMMFAVLLNGGGIVAMAAFQLIPISLLLIWIVYDLGSKRLNQSIFKFSLINRSILYESVSPSAHFFAIRMAQNMIIQGSVLIVGRFLGTAEVALYSTLRMIINLLMKLLGLISHAAWPEFTKLAAVGKKEELQFLYILIFRGSLLAAIIYMFTIEVAGRQLFHFWIGDRLQYEPYVMQAFGWYVLLTISWTLSANLLMSTNMHKNLARSQIIAGIIGLVCCAFGASNYGLVGAVIGLLVGEGIIMWIVSIYQIEKAPWGLRSMRQIKEIVSILFAALLMYWPIIEILAISWLCWRLLTMKKEETI